MITSKSFNKYGRPIGIDLFAGAGGLSLGFEQAGFDIVAAVEYDPIHCAVHEFNFPQTKAICADVKECDGRSIRKLAGIGDVDVDVVFGGAPCQGFSLIGKRALDDPRNELVFHFVRLVREIRPKYFVFENVKGLTIGEHKRFLKEIIEELEGSGYTVKKDYRVLNAADYGVPQDRHRLFLLGCREGLTLPEYPDHKPGTTVCDAIGDIPNADRFPQLLLDDSVRVDFDTVSAYSRRLRCIEDDPFDFGYSREFDRNVLTSSLRTSHVPKSTARFLATKQGDTEPVSRFFKLDPNGVCNTLRAGTGSEKGAFTSPRPIHYKYSRVITVREAARIHSYPDWFRFHKTKWHGFRQIGNSVPPLLARAVASSIINALGVIPSKPTIILPPSSESLLEFSMSEAANYYGVPHTVVGRRQRKENENDDGNQICVAN